MLCVCFLFGVGGSDRWFGTSVEDTAELPRSQGSLPVKPGGAKFGCGALSLSDARAQLKFLPRKCSLAHISAHRTVSHHRSKFTQIPRTEGLLPVSCPFLDFCCSSSPCESVLDVGA